jgi:GT2 family glycosyltransferase
MVELSIIVVSWNAKQYVQECLTSLACQTLKVRSEIILVDNASSDGTPEMVRREFPGVVLIENTSNLGFAKANNIGIRAAAGKYISLINSDVNVFPECLKTIYEYMEQDPAAGVVGPVMLRPDGSVSRSYMRFPTIWNCLSTALCLDKVFRGSRLFGGWMMAEFKGETCEVDVLNGWFLVVRRQALDETGLLDERFFMYGEDIDWSYRFENAGWKRVYFSEARALHYVGSSSAIAPTRFYIEMQRADFQYWKKHHSRAGVLGYWLTALIHQLLRMGGYAVAYLLKPRMQAEASFKVRRSASSIAWLVGAHF